MGAACLFMPIEIGPKWDSTVWCEIDSATAIGKSGVRGENWKGRMLSPAHPSLVAAAQGSLLFQSWFHR